MCNMEQLQTQTLTKHFQFFWSKVTDATARISFFLFCSFFFFFKSNSKIRLLKELFAASLELRQVFGFQIYLEHERQKASVSLR